jgi:hypothetical protein
VLTFQIEAKNISIICPVPIRPPALSFPGFCQLPNLSDPSVQYQYARSLANGQGVAVNLIGATKYYKLAADQNLPNSASIPVAESGAARSSRIPLTTPSLRMRFTTSASQHHSKLVTARPLTGFAWHWDAYEVSPSPRQQ